MIDPQTPPGGGFPAPSFTPPPGRSQGQPPAATPPAPHPTPAPLTPQAPGAPQPPQALPLTTADHGGPNADGSDNVEPPKAGKAKTVPILLAIAAVVLVALVVAKVTGGGSASAAPTPAGWYGPAPVALPRSEPTEAWSSRVDGSIADADTDGDRVFVLSFDDTSILTAFDRDGDEVWSETLGDGYESVSVIDGHLIVTSSGEGTRTAAYDPDSGQRRWRSEAAPVVRTGGAWLASAYTGESEVHLLDLDDGETIWRVDGYLSDACDGLAIIASDTGDELIAVDSATGEEVWSGDGSSGACAPGVVLALEDDRVTALSIDDGAELWSEPATGISAVGDGLAFLHHSGAEETIAVDVRTGDEVWSGDGQAYQVPVSGRLVMSDGGRTVVVAVDDGSTVGRTGGDEGLTRTSDGFIGVEHEEPDEARMTSYDNDLEERWSVVIDGSWVMPATGSILAIDDDRLTVHR